MKIFMFNPKKSESMLIPWEDKERSSLSRTLPLDLKQHQWTLYRQIWKIQDSAERSSENIWNLSTKAQNLWGKNYFYFSNSRIRKKKNSERRDALKHAFLPVLQQKADIIPALHTPMHVCIFMFCNMPFLYQIIHPSIKTLQTGSNKWQVCESDILCNFSTELVWGFSPLIPPSDL